MKKIKNENKVLCYILEHSSRHTKATVKNLEMIARLKVEGKSYGAIAKALSEATGDDLFIFDRWRYEQKNSSRD